MKIIKKYVIICKNEEGLYMKKIIIGIVSVIIIVSGIICFSCTKKQIVEKKQSTNVSSIEKKANEVKNENEQKVEEKSTNSSEEGNKQEEANKENSKKETTKMLMIHKIINQVVQM